MKDKSESSRAELSRIELPGGSSAGASGATGDAKFPELAFGVLFLLGGVYVILAFPSFLAFLFGFFGLLFGVAALVDPMLGLVRSRSDSENALLRELRKNPLGLSAVEAALATSLDVREADGILSGLAGLGYLTVKSSEGVLLYGLPQRNRAVTHNSAESCDVANSFAGREKP